MNMANGLTIRVNKVTLLEKLKENLEHHKEDYTTAHEGWKIELRQELEKKLERLEGGDWGKDADDLYIKSHEPESHEGNYEDAIGMLELATEDTIVLSHSQYTQFIKDEWGWKQNWSASNASYTATAASVGV